MDLSASPATATSTRVPGITRVGTHPSSSTSSSPTCTVKWNVLPDPGSLVTQSFPCMSFTSSAQSAKPRPVPPKRCVTDPSACLKRSKIRDSFSVSMPMPVSEMETCSSGTPASPMPPSTVTTTSPSSVNLIAFPIRLIRICRKRVASPTSHLERSLFMSQTRESPFLWAGRASNSTVSSNSLWLSKTTCSSSREPASAWDRSRMLLISPSSASPARRNTAT